MNLPSIIILAVIVIIFAAIVGKGIYNRVHRKGGCGCGCGCCPNKDMCHPK